MHAYLEFAM